MATPLIAIIVIFCIGYACIVMEHSIGVDKSASAILTGVLCWVVFVMSASSLVDPSQISPEFLASHPGRSAESLVSAWVGEHRLLEAFGEIASILFFLLGAMTIVEMIDSYGGFALITERIRSQSMPVLLWIIGFVSFFLSSVLDNLTTTIVMVSLCRKLIPDKEERLFFAGIIVIAANAGGAWTPIGDVTTTMLWIGGQITTGAIVKSMVLPSLACLVVPLLWLSFRHRGRQIAAGPADAAPAHAAVAVSTTHRNIVFALGIGGLLFVPLFKSVTHLPPFMGMLFSLGVLWVVSEKFDHDREAAMESGLHILKVLRRIDTPSVLFFLGILVAVSALEATGILRSAADLLESTIGSINVIVFFIGLLSAVVDNVPLVAAVMGMYDLGTYPVDHLTWLYLAFAAGTGGSCLIIGSAAGVAAMGMERINFFWYLRNISALALLGYVAGTAIVFLPSMF